VIRLANVSRTLIDGKNRKAAVVDVTIHVPRGSVVLITGKNGSGKSTLISLMCGILSPTTGRVFIDGRDISRLPERFINRLRRERMGMIFQERSLIRQATVYENISLPLIPTDMRMHDIREKAGRRMTQFGLAGKGAVKCSGLSGGEKQRLAIARALVNDPDIIFADEPTTHLDDDVLNVLADEIADWKKTGKTVIIATHQPGILQGVEVDIRLELNRGRCSGIAT
jgi:putative ABC transport system ATP-binding protein